MERDYEELYADAEERHPWFVARRELFASLAGEDRSARILDVGCGTGIFLAHLDSLGFENLAGVETSENLRAKFRDRAIELFDELPDRRYDKIFMLDVLEHIADDRGTLARIHRMLEPGGSFYVSVPAHPFLWSHHDEVNRHQRRYRRGELRDKLLAAGFELRKLSYWNSLALPPICLARWLGRGKEGSDLKLGSPRVLRLYGRVLRLENRLLKRFSLPLGVSLIAVAEPEKQPAIARCRDPQPPPGAHRRRASGPGSTTA